MYYSTEYKQLIAYITRRRTELEFTDKNVLIISLLSLDPFYKELVPKVTNQPTLDPELLKGEARKQIIAFGPEYSDLVFCISNLPQALEATLKKVINLTNEPSYLGFYSSLITAYCFHKGMGVPLDNDECIRFIRKAVEIAEQSQDDLDLTFLIKIMERWFDLSHFEANQLLCRVVSLLASKPGWFDLLNPGDLFDGLLNYADQLRTQEKNTEASHFYALLYSLSSSPASAMRLANLAATGQMQTKPTGPVSCDFVAAVKYYNDAIDEAINECDMAMVSVGLREYRNIECRIPPENRINIPKKVQVAIEAIEAIGVKKDKKLSFRIQHMMKRNKIDDLENYMIGELIKIIVEDESLDRGLLQAIWDFYFARHPNFYWGWFKMVANSVAPEVNQNQATQNEILLTNYQLLIPKIRQTITSVPCDSIDVDWLIDLLGCFTKHRLHLSALPCTAQFFETLNIFIGEAAIKAVIARNINRLKELRTIFDNNPIAQIINRSAELTYWIYRTTFEIEFDAAAKEAYAGLGPLPEIYRLAVGEKKGEKLMVSSLGLITCLERLKKENHPEASLKVAQLLRTKLSPQQPDASFIDFGFYVIRAMTLDFSPGDSLGIYPMLGGQLFHELRETMAKKSEGYTERQRDLIRFYSMLALLITMDPKDICRSHLPFFGTSDCKLVANSGLELLEDTKLIFKEEIRRELLERIFELGERIDSSSLARVRNMLAKLSLAPIPSVAPAALRQQDQQIVPDTALQQAQRELQSKDAELAHYKAELAKSEDERKALAAWVTVFFKTSKDSVATFDKTAIKANPEDNAILNQGMLNQGLS